MDPVIISETMIPAKAPTAEAPIPAMIAENSSAKASDIPMSMTTHVVLPHILYLLRNSLPSKVVSLSKTVSTMALKAIQILYDMITMTTAYKTRIVMLIVMTFLAG